MRKTKCNRRVNRQDHNSVIISSTALRVVFALCVIAASGTNLVIGQAHAEVITDGTVGAAQNLGGPDFVIPQSLGSTRGTNLFHSFQNFNISNTESATFTGANSIQNVISRVTGGRMSTIDGLLRSEIGQANFYFLNPYGVIFGSNAVVDVPAAFHVTTSGELRFGDGALFSAIDTGVSTLSIANPTDFGFFADHSADIRIVGSSLNFAPDSKVSLSGGSIVIDRGTLINEAGAIRLISVGAVDTLVPIDSEPVDNARGEIGINTSSIDTSGNGAGRIVMSGGDTKIANSALFANNSGNDVPDADAGISVNVNSLSMNNAFISSDVFSTGDAGNVDVSVAEALNIINGGGISSITFSGGDSGNVAILAKNLNIDRRSSEFLTVIASSTILGSSGDAGSVDVSVMESLNIVNGAQIGSQTFSEGNAGSVNVRAKNLNIDRRSSGINTGIASQAVSGSSGDAGNIDVSVTETLNIVNGGGISTSTFSEGKAGMVAVRATNLNVDGQFSEFSTGIGSNANLGSSGDAGNIDVSVTETLNLVNGGGISSSTFSEGDAGSIDVSVTETLNIVDGAGIRGSTFSEGDAGIIAVRAKNLNIDRRFSEFDTGIGSQAISGSIGDAGIVDVLVMETLNIENGGVISSSTFSEGNAGTVDVSVTKTLNIVSGGTISSSTFSEGKAGTVDIQANNLNIDENGGIVSQARVSSSGQAGSILVNTNNLTITNGGTISIQSDPFIDSDALSNIETTEINIQAQRITLETSSTITAQGTGNIPASDIGINATRRLNADSAQITTAANQADGGSITLTGGDAILVNSQVTTSVAGQGDGGDIALDFKNLVLDTGFIQANTAGSGAQGGDIAINVDALIASGNILLTGGNTPFRFEAGSGLNVIQAAAPDGISGAIDISSPELNIKGDLAGLTSDLTDVDTLVRDPCSIAGTQQSVLITGRRGGLPETAQDVLAVPLNRNRLQQIMSDPDISGEGREPYQPVVLLDGGVNRSALAFVAGERGCVN